MRCPVCYAVLVRGRENNEDDKRYTYLRTHVCEECKFMRVSADVLFPDDRQEEELHRLYVLRYARRRKGPPPQHT